MAAIFAFYPENNMTLNGPQVALNPNGMAKAMFMDVALC
jgi:hypothetical protein